MFKLFNKKKALTTIIPAFNCAPYLERCLSSICEQSLDDHEIIIVNDNSTDSTPHILSRYRKICPHIKVVNNRRTYGPGFSRNLALQIANGKYVSFVDSDDYLGTKYFELLINRADKEGADIVFSDYMFAGEEKSRCRTLSLDTRSNAKIQLLTNGAYAPWGKLYSREFISNNKLRFNEVTFVGEDVQFTWTSYLLARRISVESDALYFYRLNPDGCDNIVDRRILGIFQSLDSVKKLYRSRVENGEFDECLVQLALGNIYYKYEKILERGGNADLTREYLAQAKAAMAEFSRREIVENRYLSGEQKAFYLEQLNGR